MRPLIFPKDMDVVVLCGGLGKRLSVITKHVPKPMAQINGKPFLDVLINHVITFGFKRFILCTGYKEEIIEDYYKNDNRDIEIIFLSEEEPLGTGGAVKHAQRFIKSNPFLVMNGDSFCNLDLQKFIDFHRNNKSIASIVLTKAKGQSDVGFVYLNDQNKITGFNEKSSSAPNGYANAGVYLFNQEIFSYMNKDEFSLEYDFFPSMGDKDSYGYVVEEKFIDIGTPEKYEAAKRKLKA